MVATAERTTVGRSRRRLTRWLPVLLAVLLGVVALSFAVGSRSIGLGTVLDALFHYTGQGDEAVVRELRVPRTAVGLVVGIGLGVAGVLMQSLTRNPLADPGILGVNAGASAAVVVAIAVFGLSTPDGYVWFAFLGAGAAAVLVYLLGSRGRGGANPVRLALAGTAVSAALTAFITGALLLNPRAFDQFRFWQVGALAGRDFGIVVHIGPFVLAGVGLALSLARPLNAIALGEETGRALGAQVGRTRTLGALAVTLLCGAATATAGPIVFVGLAVPHLARAIGGPDHRRLLPIAMLIGPILLLGADVLGRVLVAPNELEVGIVTAFVGAPVFIALVRRRRIAQL